MTTCSRCELTAYLRDVTGAFDVIVSADTLVLLWTTPGRCHGGGRRIASRGTAHLHGGGAARRRIVCWVRHQPPRSLLPYAPVPRGRAVDARPAAGDRAGGAAPRSRRSGRGIGGARDETEGEGLAHASSHGNHHAARGRCPAVPRHARPRRDGPVERDPARFAQPEARHQSRRDSRQERDGEGGAARRQHALLQRLRVAFFGRAGSMAGITATSPWFARGSGS